MSWFWPEGFYALLMVAVFFAATFWLELPIAVAMVFASLAGVLAAGQGARVTTKARRCLTSRSTAHSVPGAVLPRSTIQRVAIRRRVLRHLNWSNRFWTNWRA